MSTATATASPGHSFCPGDADLTHACTKVHSKGFRNPFRFKLRPNGSLVVADVGWGTREEVNLIQAGGKSYGWPCYEGKIHTSGYDNEPGCPPEYAKEGGPNAHVAPQHDYQHGDRGNAVMAGPEYRGAGYPSGYRGDIFFADFSEGFIRHLKLSSSGQVTSVEPFATEWGGVDLKEAPNGDLAFPNGYDAIKRIVHAPVAGTPRAVLSATPTDGRAPLDVRFDATGSTDPEGHALSYDWDFGDGTPHSTDPSPVHTYTQDGVYTARLTVTDGSGLSDGDTTAISAASSGPTVNITSPTDESLYRDGDTVQLQGTATDAEDPTLPDSAYRWTVRLHHNEHVHLLDDTLTGKSASFNALQDHDADSFYEVKLTVTDSEGHRGSQTIELRPETVPLTLQSSPQGAPLSYSGIAATAPVVKAAAINYHTTISAGASFVSGGRQWVFDHWSDGGARSHNVTIPAAASTLTAQYRDAGAALGAVAALGFEEGAGPTTADASGNRNNGTLSGATRISGGRHGRALAFDGADDWVTLADSASLDLTTGMTLEAWVKPSTVTKPWQTLLMKEGTGTFAYALYATGGEPLTPGGPLQPNGWWGPEQNVYSSPLPVGAWSHVAVTSDGTTARAYVNGVLKDSAPVGGQLEATTGQLRIGGNAIWGGEFFQGALDEVRIYDRALSAADIQHDQVTAIGGGTPGGGNPPPRRQSASQPAPASAHDWRQAARHVRTDGSGQASGPACQARRDCTPSAAHDAGAPRGYIGPGSGSCLRVRQRRRKERAVPARRQTARHGRREHPLPGAVEHAELQERYAPAESGRTRRGGQRDHLPDRLGQGSQPPSLRGQPLRSANDPSGWPRSSDSQPGEVSSSSSSRH